MDISNIDRFLLKNYNDFSIKQIQINNANKIQNKDTSLKELSTYIDAKHLALENLDSQYNLTVNEKYQKHLDEKLSKLNKSDMLDIKINLPCLDEQIKISSFLSLIDEKIEKEAKKLDLLNDYKKGLLQQMFV